MRILLATLCFLFLPVILLFGSNRRAKLAARDFNKALTAKAVKDDTRACRYMERSIKRDSINAEAYSLLGQWYFEGHEFELALRTFRRASANCKNGNSIFAKPLAKSYLYTGRPAEALAYAKEARPGLDSLDWKLIERDANYAVEALYNNSGNWPISLGHRVNSVYPELFPSMAVDSQALFFTRRINNIDEDLFYALADSCGGWLRADNAGVPPNSSSQESSQCISADGHYLFYTRCDNRSENGWAEGGCDMFIAYRTRLDGEWTIGQPFGGTINTTAYEGMPAVSPDVRELFFVSDRLGGYGGYDIWISTFENGVWQLPQNAGPNINSTGNDIAPYLAADNKTLYFTSDGWPSVGGTDIFMSRRQKNGSWSKSINLGYPLNTQFDEKSAFSSLDGSALYIASDRGGPAGNYDIYRAVISNKIAPAAVSYLQGTVRDSITGELLNSAAMHIMELTTSDTLFELRSNRGDASYIITLEAGNTYILSTAHMGYQPVLDTLKFDESFRFIPMTHNVAMLPVGYNPLKPIKDSVILTVNFDANVTELSKQEKQKISEMLSPWIYEQQIIVYVNAYTDNSGNPMLNEGLSFKRAKIVRDEILSNGFEPANVEAKGWGEANPIAPNDTEEGRYRNRRVEVIVRR